MEEILEVYKRPYDPQHPVICLDESPKQLIQEIRVPIQKSDGSMLIDFEYERLGVVQMYMNFEPLAGKRYVDIRDSHNRFDWVEVVSGLLDEQYSGIPQITLVQDNHSSHKPEAFYEVYPPAKAKEYLNRINFEFTPVHGSWLNMVEFEFSILTRQILNQRISSKELIKKKVLDWQTLRNNQAVKANWQFTTQDARIKLKKLYPSI